MTLGYDHCSFYNSNQLVVMLWRGLVLSSSNVTEACQTAAIVYSNVVYVFLIYCVLNYLSSEDSLGKYIDLFLHIPFSKYSPPDLHPACISDLSHILWI